MKYHGIKVVAVSGDYYRLYFFRVRIKIGHIGVAVSNADRMFSKRRAFIDNLAEFFVQLF